MSLQDHNPTPEAPLPVNPIEIVRHRVRAAVTKFHQEYNILPNVVLIGQIEIAVFTADSGESFEMEGPKRLRFEGMIATPSGEPNGVIAALVCDENLPDSWPEEKIEEGG